MTFAYPDRPLTPTLDAFYAAHGNGGEPIRFNGNVLEAPSYTTYVSLRDQMQEDGVTPWRSPLLDAEAESVKQYMAAYALAEQFNGGNVTGEHAPVVAPSVPATITIPEHVVPAQTVPTGIAATPDAHAMITAAIAAAPPMPASHHSWWYGFTAMFGHGAEAVAHSQIGQEAITIGLQALAAKLAPAATP